jgi:uncharacterized membrane protein
MSLYLFARWLHILAGALALLVLLLPLLARKGGRLHRQAGWVYVAAMGVASLSGTAVALWRWLGDPAGRSFSLFLVYVGVLSGHAALQGVRAVRMKGRVGPWRHPLDVGAAVLLLAVALGVVGVGLWRGLPLLWGFGLVGVLNGTSQLRALLQPPRERLQWLLAHAGGMVGASIATVTAVLVVNAPRLFGPDAPLLWVFLTPTVLGVGALQVWERRLRRKPWGPADASSRVRAGA